jgi:carbamoyltransferase
MPNGKEKANPRGSARYTYRHRIHDRQGVENIRTSKKDRKIQKKVPNLFCYGIVDAFGQMIINYYSMFGGAWEMKIALGIHVGHDRCACVIKEGTVICSVAQERFDRIKFSRSSELPYEAIDAAMRYCKIKASDISCVGLSGGGIAGNSALEYYRLEFSEHYNCSNIAFHSVGHHDAHAYSVFYSSGYSDSMIFIADGSGDYINGQREAESFYIARSNKIECLSKRFMTPSYRSSNDIHNFIWPVMQADRRTLPISIGGKYGQITSLLGFNSHDAGKTMGLASYGESLVEFPGEKYRDLGFSLTYEDLLVHLQAKYILSGISFKSFIKQERENIASTVQVLIETIVLNLLANMHRQYPVQNLCLAGGLFLNCILNQKIIDSLPFTNVFILPSSGDDGQAIGCAYYVYKQIISPSDKLEIDLPYLGISYTSNETVDALENFGLKYLTLGDTELAKETARLISENNIVAIHRGRTEIGPRALCHRSILANPTNPDMKDILNNRVKHREEFRPFAPTVTAEEEGTYFSTSVQSRYMLQAASVKQEYRDKLPAITHVDGTARVQSITRDEEPFIHSVLSELKKRIGYSVVLNTSFNIAGEPIVESPTDAIKTFLKTDIDVLIIDNYIVEKSGQVTT